MYLLLLIAIITGISHGRTEIIRTRHGIVPGVKPSKNLLEFVFLNK